MSSPYNTLSSPEKSSDNIFNFTGYVGTICFLILQLTLILSIIELIYSKNLNKYSIMPYFSLLMNGTIWLFYTILCKHYTMIISNSTGVFSGLLCCTLYISFFKILYGDSRIDLEYSPNKFFFKYLYLFLLIIFVCSLLLLTEQKLLLGILASFSGLAIYYSPIISLQNQYIEAYKRMEIINSYYNFFFYKINEIENNNDIENSNSKTKVELDDDVDILFENPSNKVNSSSKFNQEDLINKKEIIIKCLIQYLNDQEYSTSGKKEETKYHTEFEFIYNKFENNEKQIKLKKINNYFPVKSLDDDPVVATLTNPEVNIIENPINSALSTSSTTINLSPKKEEYQFKVFFQNIKSFFFQNNNQIIPSINLPSRSNTSTSIGIILTSIVSLTSSISWTLYGLFIVIDPIVFISSFCGIFFSIIQLYLLTRIFIFQRNEKIRLFFIEETALSKGIEKLELENISSTTLNTSESEKSNSFNNYKAQMISNSKFVKKIKSLPDKLSFSEKNFNFFSFIKNLIPFTKSFNPLHSELNSNINEAENVNKKHPIKEIELEIRSNFNLNLTSDDTQGQPIDQISTKTISSIITMNNDVDQESYQV